MTDARLSYMIHRIEAFCNNAHNVLDHRVINNELAIVAENRTHDGALPKPPPLRRRGLEKTPERVDEVARKMRLQFNARNGNDVFSAFQAMVLGDLHILFGGDVLDADDLSDRADMQCLRNLLHHIL